MKKKDKAREYEKYKAMLRKENLTPGEYTQKLIEWCKKNKF